MGLVPCPADTAQVMFFCGAGAVTGKARPPSPAPLHTAILIFL